jgi:DNA-binding transcriptional LysR family regulator
MSLTLRQLEVFLAAAEDCNFRRTAHRLGISQPSISGRIKSIEAYLGYELFERTSGVSPRLTLEGRSFVTRAHELMNRATQLAAQRRPRNADSPSLRLKVVIGPWLLKKCVIPAMPGFCCEHPEIAADFEALGIATDGRELISSGEADICLYTGDPPEDPNLDVQIFATTGCSLFGSPGLIAQLDCSLAGLQEAPYIFPPEHHPPTRWIRARLAAVGITPRHVVARPQFADHVVQMMLEGRGLSVFFDEFLRDTPLRAVGPPLAPASRVLVVGPRARRAAAEPLLKFLRAVSAPPPCP